MFPNMGSLKALQEWCRIQCESYNDVDIKNMSSSFRDGLAFCAIIHRYRPDLIDFDSLSKENVYENNRLAFEVAEAELGIPALLDPEDMVSMKVPDRLSIITYVSQYYNFFTNKSHANPPCMKRSSGTGHIEPAQKRPVAPLEDKVVEPELSLPGQTGTDGGVQAGVKRSTLSSICAACQRHVHLVQRFLVDGKLYHRNCFRCRECSSTLLPGSYKLGNEVGSLVCTHHFARSALANQNGRPDLSKRPTTVPSVRIGRPMLPQTSPPSGRDQGAKTPPQETPPKETPPQETPPKETPPRETPPKETPPRETPPKETPPRETPPKETPPQETPPKETPPQETPPKETPPQEGITNDDYPPTPTNDSDSTPCPTSTTKTDSLKTEKEKAREDGAGEKEVKPPPSIPPNPFDDIEEEQDEGKGEETQTPAKDTANGVIPPTPVSHLGLGDSKPVPVPRRLSQPSPPPRPAPRVRPPRVDNLAVNGDHGEHRRSLPPAPRPRERSHSPGSSSLSSDAPKPPNPPWLVLVQSQEPKKKPAPPPPPGVATPPNTGSLSSLKGEGCRPATPPAPANPFDEEVEEEEAGSGEGSVGSLVSPTVVVSHPWYSITQAADAAADPDTPPSGGISSRSASPSGSRCKKRPAPPKPVPRPQNSNSALPHSQPSSSSPSPAISIESLSSASDHSSSHPSSLGGGATGDQDNPFTKSVSEPSICGPCGGSTPSPSTSANRLSPSPSPPPQPANPSSAPATPQSNRSARPPPPRPPTTPSPLAASSAIPVPPPKRICKENPFNRKASPSPVSSPKTRPPRGPRPARPPAPGHGFPLIKRKVQSDQYIPVEDIHGEMGELEKQLDELEQRGVALERKLRDNPNDEEEETLLVDWFTLIHEKHLLVRREAELVYTDKQQNLEERQADVEYELRCLLNKPEKDWNEEDKGREQELMTELVTVIEQRNQIINNMDQDRQREEEEDKLVATMLKKKDFQKEPAAEGEQQQKKKKEKKFKPMKVLKRLSVNQGKGGSPRKEIPEKDKS
ncbi:MICAL-like protein 1 isoform X1 [Coregonus clupeaformis]|uniref:MICAL-like protein 1 isoform X1 n=1 Tax=Coregonus clupeaformis TaxID=59861 RepID=UPI001E1C7D2F|nr:MICAL-like protein 1 isoform X1 [Coregonus clupeaformis]XP_041726342.2 MICAL-like protein 1 isoform X1 [Coregonus clupeaformis]